MAISVYGAIMSSWDDTTTPQMLADIGAVGSASGVATGLQVSVPTGTLTVAVAAGRALLAGTSFTNAASQNVTLAANNSGTSRTDVICAQVDWTAARTAFANAGGVTNLAAASTAAQAAAGSFVAVPLGTTLIQKPGTKWQEPLAQQVVPAGAGQLLSSNLTDVRNMPGAARAITWAGSFTQSLTLRAKSGLALFGGLFTWTGSTTVQAGDDKIQTVIIPAGFRPVSTVWVDCHSDSFSNSAKLHRLRIQPSGMADLYAGGSIPPNTDIHVVDSTWLIGA